MTATDRPTTQTKSKNAQAVQRFRDRRKAQLVTLQSENSSLRASLDQLTNQLSVLRGQRTSHDGGGTGAEGREATDSQVAQLQLDKYLLQRENTHLRALTQRCLVLHRPSEFVTELDAGMKEGHTIRTTNATSPTTASPTIPCTPETSVSWRSTPPSTVPTTAATYADAHDPATQPPCQVPTLASLPATLAHLLDPSRSAPVIGSVTEEDTLLPPPSKDNDGLNSYSIPLSRISPLDLTGAVAPTTGSLLPHHSLADILDARLPFSGDMLPSTASTSSTNDWHAMLASFETSWASTCIPVLCSLRVGKSS